MSKKLPTPQDDSFDDAIAASTSTPSPISAAPKAAPAPLSPLDEFFAGVKSREPNQTAMTKAAKAHPEFAAHVDSSGFNALTLALLSRKIELAKALVEMGSDVNLSSKAMGWCPLVIAAGSPAGDDSMALLLLANGASPSSKTHDGLYALTSACTYGNLSMATTLLDAGAQASPVDAAWLPIIAASGSGNLDLVNLLVERGANPDQPLGRINGFRSIHQACKAGHAHVISRLIELNVDVNAMDNEGNTPLHFAGQRADLPIAKLLLKAGAKPFFENAAGKTPADLCSDPAVSKALASKVDQRLKHPDAGKAKKAALAAKKAAKGLADGEEVQSAPKIAAKKTVKTASVGMQGLAEHAAKKLVPSKAKSSSSPKPVGKIPAKKSLNAAASPAKSVVKKQKI